ncbi:NADPH:adrenodoxin oxidoreductase, mitochondrial-like [Anneissia japonica]|uniref:NADPH:adrenodoxin oxidoreductase, mitochondrial-like n=1 Tax=Anneissia japonica TaxID=1529436 RepID=UPI0014259454|nr:NADPH:adrenodoxin oxidoreductase, mitochondrial-like [Anneissia japonica]XP_033095294.1 NADPH:adrenodoxin oxidoreductase, mitochondrial-like [Anneissia japonica]
MSKAFTSLQLFNSSLACFQSSNLYRPCLYRLFQRTLCTGSNTPSVCIVGSGPAGFYTAQSLLKGHKKLTVDMLERLPVPFGLVRFGVAPDHPEVKNVINQFTTLAEGDRFHFHGNVNVGKDVSLTELRQMYDAVVLSYGADDDKQLGIPGEHLDGVLSARSFVGWYNGLPEDRELNPKLDSETAVIIGQGNVALDVARILLTPIDILKKTDITQYSLERLAESKVKHVILIGRRGPLQISYTIKELREMMKLPQCQPILHRKDFEHIKGIVEELPRPKRRLTQLMVDTAFRPSEDRTEDAIKDWRMEFLRSPVEVLPSQDGGKVAGLRLRINNLVGEVGREYAVATDEVEDIPCGLVLRSIGYKSTCIDQTVPFDDRLGIVKNNQGRVNNMTGLYCSGWVKRGPQGAILSTLNDAMETSKVILKDIEKEVIHKLKGQHNIKELLKERGVQSLSFDDWKIIDQLETERGNANDRPREKITSIQEMLKVVEKT